ncbi:MAG: hypothetical protein AMXMBFR34_09610 [Myxococcaceae bacterium]
MAQGAHSPARRTFAVPLKPGDTPMKKLLAIVLFAFAFNAFAGTFAEEAKAADKSAKKEEKKKEEKKDEKKDEKKAEEAPKK